MKPCGSSARVSGSDGFAQGTVLCALCIQIYKTAPSVFMRVTVHFAEIRVDLCGMPAGQ